jgi:hypothetical protein
MSPPENRNDTLIAQMLEDIRVMRARIESIEQRFEKFDDFDALMAEVIAILEKKQRDAVK